MAPAKAGGAGGRGGAELCLRIADMEASCLSACVVGLPSCACTFSLPVWTGARACRAAASPHLKVGARRPVPFGRGGGRSPPLRFRERICERRDLVARVPTRCLCGRLLDFRRAGTVRAELCIFGFWRQLDRRNEAFHFECLYMDSNGLYFGAQRLNATRACIPTSLLRTSRRMVR